MMSELSKTQTADSKTSDTTDSKSKHTSGHIHEEDSHIPYSSTRKKVKPLESCVTSKTINHISFDKAKLYKTNKDKAFAEIKSSEHRESEKEKTTTSHVCDSDWRDKMPIEVETTEVNMPEHATGGNNLNLLFYQCKIRSNCNTGPDIEEMLTWKDNYDKLDRDRLYIQWLFPISHSTGSNQLAKPLQTYEAKAIVNDVVLRTRYMKAFEMMLAFYGMEMEIEPNDAVHFHRTKDWRRRFAYLNWAPHNLMRITRIPKSFGEFGYINLQVAWLSYILKTIFTYKILTEIDGETISYWIEALEEDTDRLNMFERFTRCQKGGGNRHLI